MNCSTGSARITKSPSSICIRSSKTVTTFRSSNRPSSKSRSAGCCASSASPTTATLSPQLKDEPVVLVVRAAVGPPRDAAARHRAHAAAGPQGLHHRLDRRAHGAARSGPFHLDDYVAYIQEFIRHIGAKDLHVISVCQPTVPVLAAISLMATPRRSRRRARMTMMGGPIDARKCPTAVNDLADAARHTAWFENNVIYTVPPNYPGVGRKVYPGFLQHTGFVAMNPDRHLPAHWDFYQDLLRGDDEDAEAHRRFYDEYNAVLDMAAEYYLDTIRVVFQDFRLPKARGTCDGELVRPQDITHDRALHDRRRTRRHLRRRPDRSAAHELCTGIPENEQAPLHGGEMRPLRHFLGPALARRSSIRSCATSSSSTTRRRKLAKEKAEARSD